MPSFEEDIAAAVDVLGVRPVGVVWGIGLTHWRDADERDAFLDLIRARYNDGGVPDNSG